MLSSSSFGCAVYTLLSAQFTLHRIRNILEHTHSQTPTSDCRPNRATDRPTRRPHRTPTSHQLATIWPIHIYCEKPEGRILAGKPSAHCRGGCYHLNRKLFSTSRCLGTSHLLPYAHTLSNPPSLERLSECYNAPPFSFGMFAKIYDHSTPTHTHTHKEYIRI